MISPKFVVIGGYVTDYFVDVAQLPSWDDDVRAESIRSTPGGNAANQAVALSRLGAQVSAVGVVGGDSTGTDLLAKLREDGVDTAGIEVKENIDTPACLVFRGLNQRNAIVWRIAQEAEVSPRTIALAEMEIRSADAILATFETPPSSMRELLNRAKKYQKKVFVNAGPARAFDEIVDLPLSNVDVLIANEAEARALLGREGNQTSDGDLAGKVARWHQVRRVCVTHGERGSSYWDGTRTHAQPAFSTTVKDPTGAGDAFTAALAARMLNGDDIDAAIRYATAAGTVAVGILGALDSMPNSKQVATFIARFPAT